MSRKSVLVGTGLLLLLAGSVCATLVVLMLHEPTFYCRAAVPPGPEREALSKACLSNVGNFILRAKEDSTTWGGTFSQEQINSYFQEDFLTSNVKALTLPEHITDPRLVFEPDRVRLGFRYHVGQFSTVVSIDMRMWLAKEESNVVALEIQGMRAGALPVSAQSVLERYRRPRTAIISSSRGTATRGTPWRSCAFRTSHAPAWSSKPSICTRGSFRSRGSRSSPVRSRCRPPPRRSRRHPSFIHHQPPSALAVGFHPGPAAESCPVQANGNRFRLIFPGKRARVPAPDRAAPAADWTLEVEVGGAVIDQRLGRHGARRAAAAQRGARSGAHFPTPA